MTKHELQETKLRATVWRCLVDVWPDKYSALVFSRRADTTERFEVTESSEVAVRVAAIEWAGRHRR